MDGDSSDEQLLAAYRGGDVRAFEKLLARYEKPIWSFLRRFVRDAEAAEDLLQEVFLRGGAGRAGVRAGLERRVEVLDLALHHRAQPLHRPRTPHRRQGFRAFD